MEELPQHRQVRSLLLFGDKSIGAVDQLCVWVAAHPHWGELVQWVLDWDSAHWYLIPDSNMAFWFCIFELLNLLRPLSPCAKRSLTVRCMVLGLLRLHVLYNEFWLSLYLCAVPSTMGAKIYLA